MREKKWLGLIVAITMAMMLISGVAQAQDKAATPTQAKELLKKVIGYAKEAGCEKTVAEINNPKGQFRLYGNAYPAASDFNGVTLANGKYAYLVGQNMIGVKDAEGIPFLKNSLEKRKKGELGFLQYEYKWKDTKTNKIETRTSISEAVSCGGKHGTISFAVTFDGKF